MKRSVVIDTNVPVIANGGSAQASAECALRCIDELEQSMLAKRVLIDTGGLIFGEYRNNLNPKGQPGPGDAFFKWLWDNQANDEHCRQVPVTPTNAGPQNFQEFPEDVALATFDRSDRKFVAVAIASGDKPPILVASDRGWWKHRKELKSHEVDVHFLCEEPRKKQK